MLRGTGTTPSVIHAAGAPEAGVSARPKVLVVLVNTKLPTPAAADSSSRVSVPVTLLSTKSCRVCEPTCGLCSVAGCRTAPAPARQARTVARSVIEPTTVVNGEASTSRPTTSRPLARSTRTSASPRCPALPVTRTRSPGMRFTILCAPARPGVLFRRAALAPAPRRAAALAPARRRRPRSRTAPPPSLPRGAAALAPARRRRFRSRAAPPLSLPRRAAAPSPAASAAWWDGHMRPDLTIPAKLSPGDPVAVVSPSWAAPGRSPGVHEVAMRRLKEEVGLEPVEYPTTRQLGASPQARAGDLMSAFADPSIKAVLATIGGDDQITVLPFLDPAVVAANPKAFFGYSDNTNLL